MNEEKLLARKTELERELEKGLDMIKEAELVIRDKTPILQQIQGAIMVINEFLKPEEKKEATSE